MTQLSFHSPIGDLTVSEHDGYIVAVDWGWGRDQRETPLLRRARTQLQAYFDEELADPGQGLPIAPAGSPYRQRVWQALRQIRPGATATYGAIAAIAGGSPRSVGQASGANPIPVLIPCHRVLAGGNRAGQQRLGGYSGEGGIATKQWLLALEQRTANRRA
ncbi:MAG: methylated-DNA--[protein]-cysteine S-methyltransferase [Alphaproteobacteria bacterium]|nr:methylated-DNA--[protein]-cysteine S-methyltransferase [Alphaproteobacteria bacterium]